MSNNLKNALTKGILLVFILNMSLFNYTAYAQTSDAVLSKDLILNSVQNSTKLNLPLTTNDAAVPKSDAVIPNDASVIKPAEDLIKDLLIKPELLETATPDPTEKIEEVPTDKPTENTDSIEENLATDKEAPEKEVSTDQLFYVQLMRAVRDLKLGKAENLEKEKAALATKLDAFIQQEKTKLEKSGLGSEKIDSYIKLLYTQLEDVKSLTPGKIEENIAKEKTDLEVKSVKKPSLFKFNDEKVFIKSIKVSDSNIEPTRKISYFETINPFIIATAEAAAPQFMPVVEDIQENPEVVISSDIKTLADELHRNPVEILNYIYTNIDYEPYYGAKKGSDGCLKEKVCNDTDSASLTIALMRASGIPARYRKGVAVMPVQQIKELLGVDEVKTAYFAFAANKVPVYVLSGNNVGTNVDLYNFAQETHLAVEWTYPEIFYDYDERGANFPNTVDLSAVQTTQDLQAIFMDVHKKQWIPADGITKSYTRVQHQIVHDSVAFNTQNFWNGFLQYQGALSPFDKYKQDLQTQTGKDITNPLYQTVKTKQARTFDILPSTRPYVFGSGVDSNGVTINIETWSQLPDVRRFKVQISILRDSDNSEILSQIYYGNKINNIPIELIYEGATETDQQVINSYGGIHKTPASLVNIKPNFVSEIGKTNSQNSIQIGEKLVLQFEYFVNGNSIYTDQKYSVAGNFEGIYIILSKLQDDLLYNDGLNDTQEILYGGNEKISWKYLREVELKSDLLEKALDYQANLHFMRAVVTQNRVLSEVGGVPTTFDFQGLTIDASSFINDYSNRGNFKTHNKDYRLLWGEQASYYEGQLFYDLSSLTAISSVKGLQYAYANPLNYSVYTINSGNQNIINSLNLSANTKQNMINDVQAGNTIITPDKPVSQGNFTGVLYISLRPDGTGTYAIGEQNGGYEVEDWEPYEDIYSTYVSGVPDSYYMDRPTLSGMTCSPSTTMRDAAQAIMNAELTEYGKGVVGAPCFMGTTNKLGSKKYSYILTTNGMKFLNTPVNVTNNWSSYNTPGYWVPIDLTYSDATVENGRILNAVTFGIDNYIQVHKNLPDTHLNFLPDGERYNLKFSLLLGTFKQHICEIRGMLGDCGDYATVYYVPDNTIGDFGEIHRVWGQYLDKLAQENNLYFERLGLPEGDEDLAANSARILNGRYQPFENGALYQFEAFYWTWTYYTYGELNNTHNANGGSGGSLGFPQSDPVVGSNSYVQQKFENNKSIEWNLTNNTTSVGQYKKHTCQLYGTKSGPKIMNWGIFLEGLLDSGIYTVESLGSLVITIKDSIYNATRYNFGDILQDAYDLVNEIMNVDTDEVVQMLLEIGGSAYQSMIDEYNTSFGPNGCDERYSYLKGAIFGELLISLIGGGELASAKLAEKVNTFNAISKGKKGWSAVAIITDSKYVTHSKLGKSILTLFSGKTKLFDKWVEFSLKDGRWKPNAHHLIPQGFRGDATYGGLINDLDNKWGGPGKFDLDSGINGVIIPDVLHPGNHLGAYKQTIFNRLKDLASDPSVTKTTIINEVKAIRRDVLDNILPTNNSWLDPANKIYLDAVKNSKSIYE